MNKKWNMMFLVGLVSWAMLMNPAHAEQQEPLDHDARMAWFREARFGMFIHFGLYSEAAGLWNDQPVGFAEYFGFRNHKEWETLLDRFNPVDFDADAIVRAAKNAGMKYLIITSKHHDGFCLFASEHTDYDVMSTPFKRDIIRELADACREHGLRFGFYYSIIDLHHPDYLPRYGFDTRPAEEADFERYVDFMKAQLKELLTNYGPIDVVWFDGEWDNTWSHERAKDLWDFVRELQPNALINNRIDKGRQGMQGMNREPHYLGDFGTPEQELLTRNPGEDWETCQTMNRHGNWGWRKDETNFYSKAELIHQIISCASMGGNMLLNVGPKADGTIPQWQHDRLEAIGQWMSRHGDTIYGSQASPYTRDPNWGRCTVKGNMLYAHVFEMPADGKLVLPSIEGGPLKAWAYTDAEQTPLQMEQRADGSLVIDVTPVSPDPYATVIAVQFTQPPTAPPFAIHANADGVFTLEAIDADIDGTASYNDEHQSIGSWVQLDTSVSWPIVVAEPGRYHVDVTYGCAADGGGTYAIEVGESRITAESKVSGGWFERRTDTIGELTITEAGPHDLRVRLLESPGTAVFDLQRIELRPVK